jgi:hypothetical protein
VTCCRLSDLRGSYDYFPAHEFWQEEIAGGAEFLVVNAQVPQLCEHWQYAFAKKCFGAGWAREHPVNGGDPDERGICVSWQSALKLFYFMPNLAGSVLSN